MPESRIRRKSPYTPPPAKANVAKPNAAWFVPVMLGLMILGLVWIVVFYITQQEYPIPGLGNWNLICGFGLLMVGFLMTTRWR